VDDDDRRFTMDVSDLQDDRRSVRTDHHGEPVTEVPDPDRVAVGVEDLVLVELVLRSGLGGEVNLWTGRSSTSPRGTTGARLVRHTALIGGSRCQGPVYAIRGGGTGGRSTARPRQRRGSGQEIAAFTSLTTSFSTLGLHCRRAYDTGHMSPSSRFAASWKPGVEYR